MRSLRSSVGTLTGVSGAGYDGSVSAETGNPHAQGRYEVRFDWGRDGAATVAPGVGAIVLVDAISFTTTVEIAVSHGLEVMPFSGIGDAAAAARDADAVLAGGRRAPGLSLSPSSITPDAVAAIAPRTRILVQSLNGSMISAALAGYGVPVIAACLRNRTAVARRIIAMQGERGERLRVAVIAAGEAREDGSVRFAVEDLFTAGAVIDALATLGIDDCSPEAAAACAVFTGLKRATGHLLTASASGRELIAADSQRDVELAAEVDVSGTVPVLGEFGYRASR